MVESPAPVSSKGVPTFAPVVEAGVLSLCAAALLATQLAYPGALDFSIAVQIVPDLIAICGIALCAWLAWRGTSGLALVVGILAVWISTYWIGQARQHDSKTSNALVFSTTGDSVRGAEFFVNGVDLGPSPARISKDDFERRVPRLHKPPDGFEEKVYVPFYNKQWWDNCWEREYVHGFGWEFPDMGKGKLYYQAQYAGEMGAALGSGGGGGGQVSIGFLFPQRGRRLQLLLNKARLADYHVSADWFRTLETFDEDGWIALRKAAQGEPGMDDVLSDWAKWKYNLDAVHNSNDAWKALMRVCREADKEHVHLTPSVGGRAVEILAKQVDPDRLVREGGRVIAQTSGAVFVQWRLAGQMQFGTADTTDKLSFLGLNQDGTDGSNQPTYTGTGGAHGRMLSPGGLVIAQALAEMWKAGIGHAQIQSEIGPDLLAWHYDRTLTYPLVLAANIGGPEVDEFLLAQPWQRNVTSSDRNMTVFEFDAGIPEINRWRYLLTCLNDEAGQKFHREHAPEIHEMAGKLLDGGMFTWDNSHLDFLLKDHEFAWGLWPQFRAAIKKRESDPWTVIRLEYTYLEKMNAPVSAFIDLWNEERPAAQAADQAFGVLRFETPAERARPIAAGLLDYFQRDSHAMDQIPEENRKYLMATLRKIVNPQEAFMAEVNRYVPTDPQQKRPLTGDFWRHKFSTIWLGGPGGLSPVVEQLANAPEPALRLLSLIAIRGTPVASNRLLLQRLLSDPDATVQSEARTVDAELQALAAQAVNELTSAGHATVQP
jgi:hypothetical protein